MKSFSAASFDSTIDLLVENQRDLRNDSLGVYYDVDFRSQRDLDDRYAQVLTFRTNNNLPRVQRGAFSADTSYSAGPAFFERVMNVQGIETVYSEDLVESATTVSASGAVASFIIEQATSVPLNRSKLQTQLSGEQIITKHLIQPEFLVVSDDDQQTFDRVKSIHNYTRKLVK